MMRTLNPTDALEEIANRTSFLMKMVKTTKEIICEFATNVWNHYTVEIQDEKYLYYQKIEQYDLSTFKRREL